MHTDGPSFRLPISGGIYTKVYRCTCVGGEACAAAVWWPVANLQQMRAFQQLRARAPLLALLWGGGRANQFHLRPARRGFYSGLRALKLLVRPEPALHNRCAAQAFDAASPVIDWHGIGLGEAAASLIRVIAVSRRVIARHDVHTSASTT